MFRSCDHHQGPALFLAKITAKEQRSSLVMIVWSKHVGAILKVLI